jgi:predicted TIM-barrel fold metal-dependent hydrolase
MAEEHTLYDGPIIDAHMHLWDLETVPFGASWHWLKGPQSITSHLAGTPEKVKDMKKTYLLQNYLQDAKGQNIIKTVHVQAECDDPRAETQWLQSVADKEGNPSGIVAYANLARDDVEDLLRFHAQSKNFRGIRQMLNFDEKNPNLNFADRGDYLTNPLFWRGFALLEKYKLSFDLQLWYHQMHDAAQLAERFPNVQIIVNHTGLPKGYLDTSEEAKKGWKDGMEELSKHLNVAVKISGLYMTLKPEQFQEYIHHTLSLFGVDRCMFASNYPVDKMNSEQMSNVFDSYRKSVKHLAAADQKKLFHDNAIKFYRL